MPWRVQRWRVSDVGYPDDVGEDARRRHACPRAVALDAHGVLAVTLGGEQHDVVAAGEVVDGLTPDQIGDTPKEYVRSAAVVSAKVADAVRAEQKSEVAKLRAEIEERDRRAFYGQIGRDNAKFFSDIAPGGDKASMWAQFRAENQETYDAIMETRDVSRFNTLVGSFYRRIGVRNPAGGSGTVAAPDPVATCGGSQQPGASDADGQKKYTVDEYLKELEKAEGARDGGDMATYREMTTRLNKALNEGRVG